MSGSSGSTDRPDPGGLGVTPAAPPTPTELSAPPSSERADQPPDREPSAAPPEAPPASRAGRNLPAAIAVGVLMAAIALASLYLWIGLFLVVILAAIVIGSNELSDALSGRGIRLVKTPLLAASVLLPLAAYLGGPRNGPILLVAGLGLMFLFTLFWRLLRHGVDDFVRDATASAFVLSYAPLMGGFAALIAASPDGADRVVTFIVLSVASDIGGYAFGVLWGRHPMAPHISPKKSWEGFAGSVTFQVALGAGLFVWLLDSSWWVGAIVGAIMTVTATLGDFVESAIKRDLGIKDMSALLPGHGGLMDRLDSIIPNTVVAYALFGLTLGLW